MIPLIPLLVVQEVDESSRIAPGLSAAATLAEYTLGVVIF